MINPKTTVKFNNGLECPILGLGTWKASPGEVTQSIRDAIDVGYRHFDCAFVYENETQVGLGLNEKIKEGTVKRNDLFITSKLWNNKHDQSKVIPSINQSLSDLGLHYLDLYLIHWPFAFKDIPGNLWSHNEKGEYITTDEDFMDTWKGMEECVDQGLAKSIGLSNFNSKQIEAILEVADIKPVNNQVECHPYLNQRKLIDFCTSKEITVTAYGPLGRPMKNNPLQVLEDKELKEIGQTHSKSIAQVCIRYQMQRGLIVIPKSVRRQRIVENWNVFDFNLSDDEMKKIDSLNKDLRLTPYTELSHHKHYPFNIEF